MKVVDADDSGDGSSEIKLVPCNDRTCKSVRRVSYTKPMLIRSMRIIFWRNGSRKDKRIGKGNATSHKSLIKFVIAEAICGAFSSMQFLLRDVRSVQ